MHPFIQSTVFSLSDDLNASWPNKKKLLRRRKSQNGNSSIRRLQRPKTAVLKRPVVLDESLKDKLDMTLTKKQFLAAVKLCKVKIAFLPTMRNRMAAVGYKSSRSRSNSRAGRRQPPPPPPHLRPTRIPTKQAAESRALADISPLRRRPSLGREKENLPNLPVNPSKSKEGGDEKESKPRRRKKRDTSSSTESVPEPCR
jgi:hypothetical protein